MTRCQTGDSNFSNPIGEPSSHQVVSGARPLSMWRRTDNSPPRGLNSESSLGLEPRTGCFFGNALTSRVGKSYYDTHFGPPSKNAP